MAYKLYYLDLRARGEPVRWLLKVLGQAYTEERISVFTQWPQRKKDFEFEVTPVLEVEGQQLHQTTVICRYLGQRHDLTSHDLWTRTRQEEVMEALHDVSNIVSTAFIARVRGDDAMAKGDAEKVKVKLAVVIRNIETRITEQGWILAAEMTWVDVCVAAYLDIYEEILGQDLLTGHPRTAALLKNVRSLPQISAWISERPGWTKFEDPEGLF